MTSKCLRRLLRSGVSFFISLGSHEAVTPAGPKVASTGQGLLMQSSAPVHPSHFSCLPLHGACHYHPSSSSSTFLYPCADIEDDLSANDDVVDELKQLARSHSCSKLHGRKQLMSSFKSLLQRGASSHNDHHFAESSAKLHELEEELPSYPTASGSRDTRSWSSSSLHVQRNVVKVPRKASSSHTSPDHGCSRGRCAPKGHVAVYVEAGRQRHAVPIAYLSHPLFQGLLERAEREYGYCQEGPGLRIPCSLSELRHTLRHIRPQ